MKNLILMAVLALSTSMQLSAQKVDLDKYHFKVSGMYALPTDPLPEDYKTYNVTYSSNSNTYYYPTSMLQELNIGGWKKLESNEKAHIKVIFETGALLIDKSEIAEREEVQKDKDGKEIGRKKYYTVKYKYSMPVGYKIEDYQKKTLKNETGLGITRNGAFSSSEFTSYNTAYEYRSNNQRNLMEQFGRELVGGVVNSLSGNLTRWWGLRQFSTNDHLWLMDSKKHPEQDSMQIMAKFIKETFLKYTAEMPCSEFKELMKPFIQYCLNLPNKYKTDEKADKKLRYSAYYNMAKLSNYLDDPDGIEKWGDMIIKNDFDPKDGESYKKDAKELREMFTKARINTRHLSFDVNSFQAPK